jgi:hypothetical protein
VSPNCPNTPISPQFDMLQRFQFEEDRGKLNDLRPAELDAMIANAQQTMADLKYLRDLSESLARLYQKAPGRDS